MMKLLPEDIQGYIGRIVFTIIGLVVGVLCLTIGFWKTLLLVVLVFIGFLIGSIIDGKISIPNFRKK